MKAADFGVMVEVGSPSVLTDHAGASIIEHRRWMASGLTQESLRRSHASFLPNQATASADQFDRVRDTDGANRAGTIRGVWLQSHHTGENGEFASRIPSGHRAAGPMG